MNKKIFIYHEDPNECRLLAHLLFDFGYYSDFYTDRKEAVEQLEYSKNFYTLIIVPFENDQDDPFGLVETLRQTHPFTPVFLISPKLKLDSITHAIRLGIRDIFQTPLEFDEVMASIDAKLQGHKHSKVHAEKCAAKVEVFFQRFGGPKGSSTTSSDGGQLQSLLNENEDLQKKVRHLQQEIESLNSHDEDSAVSKELLELSSAEAPDIASVGDSPDALKEAYQNLQQTLQKQQEESRKVIATVRQKEKDLEEAKLMMGERDAYLEECENTMMEKTQVLHEKEVELEQLKDELYREKSRLAELAGKDGGSSGEALQELENLRSELEEERKKIAEQKEKLEDEKTKFLEDKKTTLEEQRPEASDKENDSEEADWKRMQRRSKVIRSW